MRYHDAVHTSSRASLFIPHLILLHTLMVHDAWAFIPSYEQMYILRWSRNRLPGSQCSLSLAAEQRMSLFLWCEVLMAVNFKTMFFWDVTVCIWLMETSATEKPVYQTVIPTCWKLRQWHENVRYHTTVW